MECYTMNDGDLGEVPLIHQDLSMPEIDGYQLCMMIHRSPTLQAVSVVMLSTDTLFDPVRANLVGASNYLTKSIQERKVLASLERFHSLETTAKFASTFSY